MALNDNALCTVQEVKNYYEMTGTSAEVDTLIETIINGTSQIFETYCDRAFLDTTYTEYYDGNGKSVLFLDNSPATTISGIWDDTEWTWADASLIPVANYRTADTNRVVFRDTVLNKAEQNVRIIYNAGYTSIPEDLRQTCTIEVARIVKESLNKTFYISSKQDASGSVSYKSKDFLPATFIVLNKYKRKHVL